MFANWLTKDEEASLADLRADYSIVKDELEKYRNAEESEKKEKLFESEEYKVIENEKEFIDLKENHKDISYSELTTKLDSMLLSYAKSGKLKFEVSNQNQTNKASGYSRIPLQSNANTKKKSRYGSLFSK